jgi:hypothetical protein
MTLFRTLPAVSVIALLSFSGACRSTPPTDDKTDADTDTDTDADADTDTDTDSDTDTDTDPQGCPASPGSTDPWEDHPIALAGAAITNTPYDFDGGVDDVAAATVGQTTAVDVDLVVTKAIVTARAYVPAVNDGTASFWFEDQNAAMYAYRVNLGGFDPVNLKPGDEISFTAKRVVDFNGTLEVAGDPANTIPGIENFTVVSSGNDVHVVDGMDANGLSFADDGLHVTNVWGELVAGPTDCGANCFDFEYGGNTITFRTQSSYDVVGDCIHYIGPVTQFGGVAQLDANDFDWYDYY